MDVPVPGDKGYLIDRIEQAHADALLDEAEMTWRLPIDENQAAS